MKWLNQYVGKPFVDGGRGPDNYDCWGLVCAVYKNQFGIELPSYGSISSSDLLKVRREIEAGVAIDSPWRQVCKPSEFDVAVMRLPNGRRYGHVGVYTGDGHILHVQSATGVVMDRTDNTSIRHRIMGYWRYEGDTGRSL